MNNYQYDDIYIGLTAKFPIKVSEEYFIAFQKHTGDINPLHSDNNYALLKGFPTKVVFGMLTASFYSTLAGVYLPGERSLLHSVDTKFLSPVYCGDILEIEGTVTEKNDLFQQITIKATIKNQDGKKVSKAVLKVGVV